MREAKKEIVNIYPLSPMQEGMLFHSIKEPESNIYFRQVILSVSGALDKDLLEKSFTLLVKRHDALRTVFLYDQVENPLQVVLKEQEAQVSMIDISQLTVDEIELFIEDFLKKDREKIFNLTKDMLVRISVIKVDEFEYKMLWSFHHILMDGWCTGILLNDLFEIYKSLKYNMPLNLGEVKPYANYVKWISKKDQAKSLSYWKEYLSEYRQQSIVPKYKMTNESMNYLQEEFDCIIEQNIVEKMDALAKRCKVSLNTLFQAVWGVLLQYYNNVEDVVFGTVVSGRSAELLDVDRMVGLFINTIPVRVKCKKEESFAKLLSKLQKAALESERHSYYPLYEIHANTELKQGLFDHIMAFENYPMGKDWAFATDKHNIGFTIDDFEMYQKTNYNFNIIVTPSNEIKVKFIYNANMYDGYIIQNIKKHIDNVILAILDNPQIEIGKIDYLSSEEKQIILNEFNNKEVEYPYKTIHEIFEEKAFEFSNNIAVTLGNEKLTYSELNQRANQVANVLVNNGIQRGSIVGVMMYPSLHMIWSILGILKAGGAYLPIDPDYPEERISFMLEDSGTNILLTKSELKEKTDFKGKIIDVWDDNIYFGNSGNLENINQPNDLAYIIYTSGTTGNPKGVMIEHRNVVSLMCHDGIQFSFDDKDVWTMFHSFCFDFSVWEMYGALLNGGRLVVIPKHVARDTLEFLTLISREKVTVLNQTPSAFYSLINEERKRSGKDLQIRYIVFGGEALKPILLRNWRNKYPDTKLINMYGITETTVHVTYKEITENEMNLDISNIGKPIPTQTSYIMDKNMRILPIGIPGELCVGGFGVARGYLNRSELTAEKFVSNINYNPEERLYKSGDLVRMLIDGNMEYIGRIDNQVKIRGFRVELGEIEASLLKHGEINEAVVVCNEDSTANKYLCAYYISHSDLTVDSLREHLLKELPEHMIPSRFVKLDKMPINSNGKIDRKALPKPSGDIITGTEYVGPENEEERKLISIWATVLEVNTDILGVKDNFFSLGGDSIKAIKLVSLMNKHLKLNIQLKDLYESPTIQGISKRKQSNEFKMVDPHIEQAKKEIDLLKKSILEDSQQSSKLPKEFEDFYPMSEIEMGMVYYTIKNPEEAVYHDQSSYRLKGISFHDKAFQKALLYMIEKHPILRTSFNIYDFQQPIQIVHKSIIPKIDHFDLTEQSEDESQAFIENCLAKDRMQVFDIDKVPLWRLKVFDLKDNQICMCLIFHHAILDGWSVACFMTEFINIYLKYKNGEDITLQKLKHDYSDYIVTQWAVKGKKEIREYWKRELNGYKRFVFPTRTSFSESASPIRKVFVRRLNDHLMNKVKDTAKKFSIDIKSVCFTAYLYMLYTIGNEDEIVAGVVEHNRLMCEDGDKILGCFLNTVPVRVKFRDEMRWDQLLKVVSDKFKELKNYGRLPFFEILKTIDEGIEDENPIFDSFFNYVDFHVYNEVENEDMLSNIADAGGYEQNNAALDFTVSVTPGYLGIKTTYKTSQFEEAQINSFVEYFINALDELTREPEGVIRKDKIISKEEIRRLLYDFNDTLRDYDRKKTVHELFKEQIVKTPNDTALVFKNKNITYQELDFNARGIAGILAGEGVSKGNVVGIMMSRSIEMVECMMAVLKAGAAYLPIDPEFPEERIKYILENSGAKILLTQKKVLPKFDFNIQTICVEDLLWNSVDDLEMKHLASSRDTAYVIYTSGSTGKPKGVMIEHRNVVNFIEGMKDLINFSKDKTILALTTISFDISVLEILLPLTLGMKVVIADEEEQKDPELLNSIISKNDIDILQITPTRLQMLMTNSSSISTLRDLKEIMVGGEAFPLSLLQSLKSVTNARIYNMYGPTETTIWSCVKELTEEKKMLIGRPISNTRVYILDKNGEMQPTGSIGELCIAGDGVARGYINFAKLEEEKFIPDILNHNERMYKTGDMARWLPEGDIEFIGRKDEQVKIRGFRVELAEIEIRLESYGGIDRAVVAARTDNDGIKYLCAYYISGKEINTFDLKEYLALELPDYMIPSYFISIDCFPLTPNGKIDRKRLPEPNCYMEEYNEFTLPKNDVEEKLLKIYKDTLGLREISTSSNFFELGGHSLKAAVLIARIKKEFCVQIPLKTVFSNPTVTKLSQKIQDLECSEWMDIKPVEKRDYYPLTSEQKRIYLAEQFEEGGIAYNMPGATIIEGDLDFKRVEDTFKYLIRRHEVYRTSICFENGELVQKINDFVDFKIDVIEKGNKSILDIIYSFIRPFKLEEAPLIRVGLVRLEEGKNLMLFDVHHIISDGVSASILIKEFSKVCQDDKLPELRLQYRDYAVWQENVYKNEGKEKLILDSQKQYWKNILSGDIPLLNIPTDYPRTSRKSFEGEKISCKIGSKLASDINKFALECETTIFTVMLSTYDVLLSKLSGQKDIIIGVPVTVRPQIELQDVIGLFVNTLPIRIKIQDDRSVEEIIKQAKEHTLRAFENQSCRFEKIIESIDFSKQPGRNPLFDTMFSMQNIDIEDIAIAGLRFTKYEFDSKVSKMDLTLEATEIDNDIVLVLEYSTRLFRKETAERILNDYIKVLDFIVKNSNASLKDLKLVDGYNKRKRVISEDVEFCFD